MRGIATALLATLAAAGCGKSAGSENGNSSPPPAEPALKGTWVEARRQTVRRFASAVGTFKPRQTTHVGSQVSGRVREVLVDVGAAVKKDQELVRLDPALFEIELTQRKADLEAARVSLGEAELHLGRMKNLWENPGGEAPSIPRKLYDDALSRHQAGVARMKQAEAGVAHAEERLRETVIRAPYDATVTRRFVDPGEPVTSMPVTQLLELQETRVLELVFSLPQELLRAVRPGTPVEYEVEGLPESRGSGTVEVVFPALEESTRSLRCRVLVNNAKGTYRAGLLAAVRVLEEEISDAVTVPRGAVTETGGGWQVWKAEGEKPVRRAVKVGVITGEEAEIREGLEAGDKVLLPEN